MMDNTYFKPKIDPSLKPVVQHSVVIPGIGFGYMVEFGVEHHRLRLDTDPGTNTLPITGVMGGIDQEPVELTVTEAEMTRINAVLAEWVKRG